MIVLTVKVVRGGEQEMAKIQIEEAVLVDEGGMGVFLGALVQGGEALWKRMEEKGWLKTRSTTGSATS